MGQVRGRKMSSSVTVREKEAKRVPDSAGDKNY